MISDLPKLKVKFSASCKSDRVAALVKLVHHGMADIPGESKSAWNENKGELFTYHYDTLKDIGKKYNLAWGLL